jgi:hypothetical protein
VPAAMSSLIQRFRPSGVRTDRLALYQQNRARCIDTAIKRRWLRACAEEINFLGSV